MDNRTDEQATIESRLIQLTAELERLPGEPMISVHDRALKHAELCREREQLKAKLDASRD